MSGRRPAAFDLETIRYEPDDIYPPEEDEAPLTPTPRRKRRGWWGILLGALAALASLGVGLSVDRLIADLFARAEWLGWLATALAALAALAILIIAARETAALLRLQRIDHLRESATAATEADDREGAWAVIANLVKLYDRRPETARGRAALARYRKEVIDGRDLIGLAERELLAPLDTEVRARVTNAAQRVAVVTAVSPRTTVDVLFVAWQAIGLIRRIAETYGARPGLLGLARLARETVTHLAVTGGISAGDSIVQQVLGHGIAARLSARLGEGVVNGLLTARVGIAAAEVCRPLPYREGRPPRLSDVMKVLRPMGEENGKRKG